MTRASPRHFSAPMFLRRRPTAPADESRTPASGRPAFEPAERRELHPEGDEQPGGARSSSPQTPDPDAQAWSAVGRRSLQSKRKVRSDRRVDRTLRQAPPPQPTPPDIPARRALRTSNSRQAGDVHGQAVRSSHRRPESRSEGVHRVPAHRHQRERGRRVDDDDQAANRPLIDRFQLDLHPTTRSEMWPFKCPGRVGRVPGGRGRSMARGGSRRRFRSLVRTSGGRCRGRRVVRRRGRVGDRRCRMSVPRGRR